MPGDVLLVDPRNAKPPRESFGELFADREQPVSKLARIDDRYYDLTVSPAGDKITLTPSNVPIGYLASPHRGIAAVMWNDIGLRQVVKGQSKPVPVPEGQWKLDFYEILIEPDPPPAAGRPVDAPPEKRKEAPEKTPAGKEKLAGKKKDPAKEPVEVDFWGAVLRLTFGVTSPLDELQVGPPGCSMLYARTTEECRPVVVRQGQTATLPFGPPYRPVVWASDDGRGSGVASLSLSLVGSGGELVDFITVNGRRPPPPEFTISTVKGEVVQKGRFGYGGGLTGPYSWRAPAKPADEYQVRVRMKAGPFRIDESRYSVIRPSDWQQPEAKIGM